MGNIKINGVWYTKKDAKQKGLLKDILNKNKKSYSEKLERNIEKK